ncbi:MAG: hypothetical protein OXH70_01945 [Acidobacteria bacterium]|nr:hypothetical protein [Acidobacteriota bacterium]MCY3971609.1 hypothetical protein [Acidobacteriota bacterium]
MTELFDDPTPEPKRRSGCATAFGVTFGLLLVLALMCVAVTPDRRSDPDRQQRPATTSRSSVDLSKTGVLGVWHDSLWNESKTIARENSTLYLHDGYGKEPLERWSECRTCGPGPAFAMTNRTGQPDNIFVITPSGSLRQYTDCEFGPCTKYREMRRTR